MKKKQNEVGEKVEKLLKDPHSTRRRKPFAKVKVIGSKNYADVYVYLIDKDGFLLTDFSFTTSKEGYVHPGQVIDLIIDSFEIGVDKLLFRAQQNPAIIWSEESRIF